MYGLVLILFLLTGYVVFHQTQIYQEHYFKAKYIAEETATAASQYNSLEDYSWGEYTFNQVEARKAISYFLKKNFNLNDGFEPELIWHGYSLEKIRPVVKERGYWREKIQYEVTFIDRNHPNFKGFPETYSFVHFGNTHEIILNGPSVILTVNLGKPPSNTSKLFSNNSTSIVTAIHTFED